MTRRIGPGQQDTLAADDKHLVGLELPRDGFYGLDEVFDGSDEGSFVRSSRRHP
jgi:hypothetical protein